MVYVKLKMRKIYKSFLSLIALLIFIILVIGIFYLFYDKVVEVNSDIEVINNLSINYIDGKKFDVEDKVTIKFSITNSSKESNYYNIGFIDVIGNGNYKLLDNEEIILEGTLSNNEEINKTLINISEEETKLYTLEIENIGTNNLSGYITIKSEEGKNTTFSDYILKNSPASDSPLTKVGSEIATEDEGLIKSNDDSGTSYYFRGSTENNYVYFANMLWRIVRINGDGTVRIILDGVIDTLSSYYTLSNIKFDFEESNINEFLDNWFNDYLSEYTNYIANTKYCNDISYDENYNFNTYTRIMTNKIPTFNCLGTSFKSNIGILSIDEVILAGASPSMSNTNYYLYNSSIKEVWYTMSGASGSDTYMNLFMIDSTSNIRTDIEGNLYRNVRPVINLVKNINMIGLGTKDNPYILEE